MTPDAAGRGAARAWRHGSFWVIALSYVLLVSSAGAPVPIFAVYQSRYAVSDADLTTAFALYVVAVGCALLALGRVSDVVGRRPLGVTALCLGAGACLVMSRVDSVSGLYVGRMLQGVAIGTGTSVLGAWTYELRVETPSLASAVVSGVPTGGLAIGALLGGALLDSIDGREGTVMVVIATALAVSAVLSGLVRETTTSITRRTASARPSLALPVGTRGLFVAAATLGLSAWILGGFYQSLLPSVFARGLGTSSHLVGGIGVAALVGTSAVTAMVVKRRPTSWLLAIGTALLATGALVVGLGLWASSLSVVLLGTVVTGIGHGSIFLVAVRVVAERCDADARAGVLAAFYLACYVGSVLPMLLAGWAAEAWGLSISMAGFMLGAALLSGPAALLIRRTIQRSSVADNPTDWLVQ